MDTALVPVRWTHLWDMHSGGRLKEATGHFFIEAPEDEAKLVFFHRYGHSPDRVTCTCCGSDYSISEHDSLEQASGYQRNCAYNEAAGGYIEERDRSMDRYILEAVGRLVGQGEGGKRLADLYRMARDRSSPNEARVAMDKLAAIPDYPSLWRPPDFVPFEEFERTGRLSTSRIGGSEGPAVIIRAAVIVPGERVGTLPEQGYVWVE